jgi:hypothetical protein
MLVGAWGGMWLYRLVMRPVRRHELRVSNGLENTQTRCLRGCKVYVSPTDVSLTKSSWMLRPIYDLSLVLIIPHRCVPTLDRIRGS